MIEAKIKKSDSKKGYDIEINASGNPIELAKEIAYLALIIHDKITDADYRRVFRNILLQELVGDSDLWTKEPVDE